MPVLIGFILLSQAAGLIGSLFTISSIPGWYASLTKPFFTPPNWLFGPVWLALYTLMGIALYMVWQKKPKSPQPYLLFGIQLGLNTFWSILFFGFHLISIAFFEILLLLGGMLLTAWSFSKVSRNAALLFIPYIAWVCIATALNGAV